MCTFEVWDQEYMLYLKVREILSVTPPPIFICPGLETSELGVQEEIAVGF